jgi:hypothetical protein
MVSRVIDSARCTGPSIVSFTQDRADETGDGSGGIVTSKKPLARYGAVEGALASGFATPAELRHCDGRNPALDTAQNA